MNPKNNLILALAVLLLTGCTKTAVSAVPSLPIATQSAAIPAATASSAGRKAGLPDRLPADLSEDFVAWVQSQYGGEVSGSLNTALQSGSYKDSLWFDLTGSSLTVLKDRFQGLLDSPETARSHHIYLKDTENPHQVILSFAGDISFADGYANMAAYDSRGGISQCIMPEVRERMAEADIMTINNEFAYSRRGTPLSGKAFAFRADPSMAENLKTLSVDIVSAANNHVYDYGPEAFSDTLDTLSAWDIPYAGAGRNIEEAKEAVFFIAGGFKIAYVSATQIERTTRFTKGATETCPGVLRTDDLKDCLDAIDAAKADSDFVVVLVHWGTEGTNYFEEDQRQLARRFIDHGAGLVVGCHPHVLQGIEYYQGVPIVYSLGNFWFNSRTLAAGLMEATLSKNGLEKLQFIPALQKDCRTSLVTSPDEKQAAIRFMEDLSTGISMDEDGIVTHLPE